MVEGVPLPVWTVTLAPAFSVKVGNLNVYPLVSRSVQPVITRAVVVVFVMMTYSALRLTFVPVSLPGESYRM